MKVLATIILAAFTTLACAKEETKVTPQITDAVTVPSKPAENTNCVKKDKNGKCPPLPNSPKPTPKKPAEKK
jgi:hypothetical protein